MMSSNAPAFNLLLAHGPDSVPVLLSAIVVTLLIGVAAIAWGGKLKKSTAPQVKQFGNVLTVGGYFILGLSGVLCLVPAIASFG